MAEITYGSLWQQLVALPHSSKLSVERTCRSTAEQRTRDRIGNIKKGRLPNRNMKFFFLTFLLL